jgi:signal transduction histidine kinase
MSPVKHRRIILIDTRFQLRMAAYFILLQVLLTGLFSAVLYLFMDSELKAGLASAHAAYRSLDQMLLPIVGVLAGFSFLLSTVLVTVFVVFLSHRIAGPLHRFRSMLDDLGQRRIPSNSPLRPKDQLGEISESMGRVVNTLSIDLDQLNAAVASLRKAQESHDAVALDKGITDLTQTLAPWKRVGGA